MSAPPRPTTSGSEEPEALRSIRETAERIRAHERELAAAVRRARLAGHSWQTIAWELGVTRQAAHRKYGKR